MSMTSARPTLIVCEQSGHWASAIRRLFSPVVLSVRRAPLEDNAPIESNVHDDQSPILGAAVVAVECRIVEARTNENCLAELAQSPQAVVGVELCDATRERALDLLSTIAERYPACPVVVLADRSMRHYEWLARELGAIHFVASPRQLASLATIVARHSDHTASSNASEAESGRSVEDIWRSLPWG
jgi:DNA-binding NtrC family response regulator